MGWLTKFNKHTLSKEKRQAPIPDSEVNKADYRAVEIKPGKRACDKVMTFSDKIFLCKEAPFLPLDLCSSRNQCNCRYQHYSDRRQQSRRSADNGLPAGYVENERRARVDRRQPQLYI